MDKNHNSAFTIVELLVVIVVIGILAAITIVSYSGIQTKAIAAGLQNDLDSNAKLLKMYNVEYGYYPSSIDSITGCPSLPTPDTRYCLKSMSGTALSYTGGGQNFSLINTHIASNLAYRITENNPATAYVVATSFLKNFGTTSRDVANSVAMLNDGNYVVIGDTSSVGSIDGAAQKFSPDGSLLWAKTFGGASSVEYIYDVTKTSDGGFAAVGYTNGFGGTGNDAYITKFDSDGVLQWARTWGNTNDDIGCSIDQSPDGNIYVGGYLTGQDAFIIKYDINGNFIWNRVVGISGDDTAVSLTATSDNGVAFVGQGGVTSARIDKFSSDGTLSWDKIWEGSGTDRFNHVIQTLDSGFVAVGYTSTYGSGYQAILVKLLNDGTYSWMKTYDLGSSVEVTNSILQLSDSSFVMTGVTNSVGAGGYDSYISKLDGSGTPVWTRTFGGASAESTNNRLLGFSDGGFLMVGSTNSLTFGDYDMFFAKYKSDGSMPNCSSTYCKPQTFTVTSRTVTFSNAGSSNTSPSASKSDVTASTVVASYNPSTNVIAAP